MIVRNQERNIVDAFEIDSNGPGTCFQISCSECPPLIGVDGEGPYSVRLEHKNLANLVSPGDISCLTALEWAVDVVRVGEIVVLGHYGCQVVEAALHQRTSHPIWGNWIAPIQRTAIKFGNLLEKCANDREKSRRLCEVNAVEQALNACRMGPVAKAWENGDPLKVTTRMFDPSSGVNKDLAFSASSPAYLGNTSWPGIRTR